MHIKLQFLIQWVWEGVPDSVLLTSSQVILMLLVYSLNIGLRTDRRLVGDPLPDCSKQVKSHVGVCDDPMKCAQRPGVEGEGGSAPLATEKLLSAIGLPSQGLFSLPSLWEGTGLVRTAPILTLAETFPLWFPSPD